MGVVPRPLAEAAVIVNQRPLLSAIVRAIQTTFLRFDQSPHAVRIRRDCYSNTSHNPAGQSIAFHPLPRAAAVARAINAAARAAALHPPGLAARLPQGREQNVGI